MIIVKCPTCEKPVTWEESSKSKPFCSERCKLIDLGEWANEEKAIPGHDMVEDEDKPDSWEF